MKKKTEAGKIILFLVCCLVAIIMVIPFIWMLSASFKLKNEIFSVPIRWIPEVFHADNYETIMQKINFPRYFFNTAKVTIIITLLQLLTCSMAAYAFSKLRFPGRDTIFLAYLGTMMVPWHAIMIPQFIVIQKLHLYDNHLSLILTGAFSAFGVFVLRQNMLSIPDSLNEAAKIDGCGTVQALMRVLLPVSAPGIVTTLIFVFINSWNEYTIALTLISSDLLKPITVGINVFYGFNFIKWQYLFATSIFATIPVVVLFLCIEKHLVAGLTSGGVKG